MTFHLAVPIDRIEPLRWVADVVLSQILGMPVEIEGRDGSDIVLSAEGRSLTMPSIFPHLAQSRELWWQQMPSLPLVRWLGETFEELDFEIPLPVLFGEPHFEVSGDSIDCSIDILGTAFFMLSRFEEVVLQDRDEHDRFPGVASLAWKEDFLFHPLVDQYAELLCVMMHRLWPGLERKMRQGTVNVSCDVDQPFDNVGRDPVMLARVLRYELFKRRRPDLAVRRAANFIVHRFGSHRFDPFYTFDWYMDACERHGRRAAFYFIADHSQATMDGTYEIDDPRILSLMGRMASRGHEIGMHGSYNTYLNGPQLVRERHRLQRACHKAGVGAEQSGNRQHYLRWNAAKTPDLLEAAGFHYDSSGSFADRPGFRYGTAHSFPMWSWQTLAPLKIVQKPLIMMEGSVISRQYLGLGHSKDARALMHTLKERALRYGGDFSILWHNSELVESADRRMFEDLLE